MLAGKPEDERLNGFAFGECAPKEARELVSDETREIIANFIKKNHIDGSPLMFFDCAEDRSPMHKYRRENDKLIIEYIDENEE